MQIDIHVDGKIANRITADHIEYRHYSSTPLRSLQEAPSPGRGGEGKGE